MGEKVKGLEIQVGQIAKQCRVMVDGVDISGHVTRVVIVADVRNEPVRVYLTCLNRAREPYVVKGQFAPDSDSLELPDNA